MQGNSSSFQVDFGYTELFHIPVLTTVSFKPIEGFLGDLCSSFKQIKLLTCLIGNKALLCTNAGELGLISQRGGSFMVFLKLRWEPGVHSRVTAGVAINNFCFFQRRQDSSVVKMDTSGV